TNRYKRKHPHMYGYRVIPFQSSFEPSNTKQYNEKLTISDANIFIGSNYKSNETKKMPAFIPIVPPTDIKDPLVNIGQYFLDQHPSILPSDPLKKDVNAFEWLKD